MFIANGWVKFIDKDNYANGLYDNGHYIDGNDIFKSDTLQELIEQLKAFSGSNDFERDDIFDNKINFCVMENDEGIPTSVKEMEWFKEGKIDLYYCVYSFSLYMIAELNIKGINLK